MLHEWLLLEPGMRAGTARGTILISLPGSQNAVRLGMTTLVIPELGHLVREVTR